MNKRIVTKWIPSRSFFLGTIGITLLVINAIIYASVKQNSSFSMTMFGLFVVSVSITMNLVTLFYSGFIHALKRGSVSMFFDPRSMIASIGVTQGLAATLNVMGTISSSELAISVIALQIWGMFLFFKVASDCFMVTRKDIKYLPHTTASAVGAAAVIAVTLRHWFSAAAGLNTGLIWQTVVTAVGLFGTLLWLSLWPRLRLSPNNFKESVSLRLSGLADGVKRSHLFALCSLSFVTSATLLAICTLLYSRLDAETPILVMTGVSTLFMPCLFLSWSDLREQSFKQAELVVSSKLAGDPALRFLRRNLKQERVWAAAVGLRTTVFTVDHDPDNQIAASLPATLNQIRNEEISRCIDGVLAKKIMHNYASGQRVFGALDPEQSSRSSVDLLKLFACLYLDAGPLIERRINGLMALLPIVNPGLARVLKPDILTTLMKRNQWFFHFDYHWVDQHMINTPGSTRYGVHLDPLPSDLRLAMIEYLRKSNGMGNFLWIGKDAQERLLQEAPMLAPIIEPVTLRSPSGHEYLVFVMKFENLIPRLQRYFDLDQLRGSLMDFEPSKESSKLINIFKLQASQATSATAMMNLVDALVSYPWRGFKEKDQALKIIVLVHQFASQAVANSEKAGTSLPPEILKLQSMIQDSVERVGYPAQILHHAQLHKIALRDIQRLISAAKNALDPRFEESWVLLGALDFRRYNVAERSLVLSLLQDQGSINRILAKGDIHGRYIYAVLNIVKSELHAERDVIDIHQMFSNVTTSLCAKSPSAETLTILLDAITFISQITHKEVLLTDAAKTALDLQVQPFEASRAPYATALWSRWSELRHKQRPPLKAS